MNFILIESILKITTMEITHGRYFFGQGQKGVLV